MTAKIIAAAIAIVSAVTVLILTVIWMDSDYDGSYLGGLNTNELLFNWHPILMVAGLIVCGITSLMSFRVLPFEKPLKKNIHATLHIIAIICISLGVSAVFQANNYKSKNIEGQYSGNLYSMHSILGIIANVVYGSNYIIGFGSFLLYSVLGLSDETKAAIMPFHILLGTFALFVSAFAVETGIMELTQSCTSMIFLPALTLSPPLI